MMLSPSSIWNGNFSASQRLNLITASSLQNLLIRVTRSVFCEHQPTLYLCSVVMICCISSYLVTTFPLRFVPHRMPLPVLMASARSGEPTWQQRRKSRARSHSFWHQPLLQRGRICVLSSAVFCRWGCHGDVAFAVLLMGVCSLCCTHTHTHRVKNSRLAWADSLSEYWSLSNDASEEKWKRAELDRWERPAFILGKCYADVSLHPH